MLNLTETQKKELIQSLITSPGVDSGRSKRITLPPGRRTGCSSFESYGTK